MRYFLPETLAQYGRDRLSPADSTTLSRRHRDWCDDLVSSAERRWFTRDQVDLFARMRREHANIRAALATCAKEVDGAPTGLAMASSLRFYWVMNGSMAEGRHWLDRFLAQYDAPPTARVKALRVGAHLAALLVDYPGAQAALAEAGRLADEVADPASRADVAQVQGLYALFVADTEPAAELFRAAAEGHRHAGNDAALAYDELQLAIATMSLGDLDVAVALIEDALRLCEPIGESWTTALAWFALGVVSASSGDHARAKDAARRSIRLRQPLGDVRNIGLNFETLAWSAAASGDCEVAAQMFGAARAVEKSVGVSIRSIGYVAELHERYDRVARQVLGDAEFERWWTVGFELVFEEAVEVALADAKPRASRRSSPPAGPSTSTAARFGLTKREWEIAQLVGKGMSNRAIASQLVISPRTAETHVEHILVKLNFTSRVQVAAWLAQQPDVSS
jgi:non-specific serine/threonine protein kinase